MVRSSLKVPAASLRYLAIMPLLWLIIAVMVASSAAMVSGAPVMEITVNEHLISARLVDAPLIEVLQRISKEFGFKAHYYGDLSEILTLSFNSLPLEKCLRLLTANQSLSIASMPGAEQSGESEARQIAEIWVLSRNPKSRALSGPVPVRAIASAQPADNPTDNGDLADEEDVGQEKNLLLNKILDNPNADKAIQRQTIQDLVDIGDAESVMTMASYMANADNELLKMLINGIGSIKNEQSTQVLGTVFEDETETDVRMTALRELVQRKNEPAARAILEGARSDSDQEVKSFVEKSLAADVPPGK